MINLNNPIVKVTELQQVGWVVRNADKTMESMLNNFGIGPWDVYVTDSSLIDNSTFHGKPAKFSFKAAMTHNLVGGIQIELIEPLEGDSMYTEHLKKYGESIQHMGWLKLYSLEDFNKTKKALEKAGFPCIQGGVMHSNGSERKYLGTFGYFDTTRVLNTVLEVLEISASDPSKSTNPPTYVYPANK